MLFFGRLKKAYYNKHLLMVYLVSYLAILVIPVIIGSLFYRETIITLEQSLVDTQLKAIVSTRERIDQKFKEVEAMATQLALNSNIIALQTAVNPIAQGKTVVAFNIVQSNLLMMNSTNQFVDSFIVYFNKSNAIMTPDTVYLRLQDVYGKLLNFSNMDYLTWQKEILRNTFNREILPPRQIRIGSFNKSYIIYAQSIPISASYNNTGNILVFIDEQRLLQLMDGLKLQDGGWVSIHDAQGTTLLNYAPGREDALAVPEADIDPSQANGFKEQIIDGKSMLLFWDQSPGSGWMYTIAVSKDVVMSRVVQIRNLLLIVLGATVVLGLMAVFALAYTNFLPLRDVIRLLSDQMGSKPDGGSPENISGVVAQLIERDKNLQVAVERQKPLLRASTLESLLHGYSASEEQLMTTLQMLDLRIGPYGIVVILRIEGYGEPDASSLPHLKVASAVLRETVLLSLGETDYMIDTTLQDIILILSLNTAELHIVHEKVTGIVQKIIEHSNVCLTAAVGNTVSRLLDWPRSYQQAQEVLEESLSVKASRIVWYSKRLQDSNVYIYRPETELQIINLVKGANAEELKRVLDGLYNENQNIRSLSPLITRVWQYDLCGTLVKLTNQVRVDSKIIASINEIARELGTRKTKDGFGAIRNLFMLICQDQGASKHSRLQNMIRSISEYIYANYHAPWLGLTSVAEHFGISEAYLSQLYRDQTGINFSDDLENYRIKRAKEMLAGTEISIEEIAVKTGYQSATAFRRAFKRVEGVPPTEFRNAEKFAVRSC